MSEAKPVVHRRLTSIALRESQPLAGGEHVGFQIGRNADSVVVVRLEGEGIYAPITAQQRGDGFLVSKAVPARGTEPAYVAQCVVPFANLRGVSYGP